MQNDTALRALCDVIVDCPHSTPKWKGAGVLVLRSHNIRDGRLDLSDASFTDEEHYKHRSRRAELRVGDLVITREAPMGEVCMIPESLRCCLGQRMVLLRPDSTKCDGRFLLYAIQSPAVQNQIAWSEGTGSTVSNLRIPHLEALRIPTPPLSEQRAIAEVLCSLDDKIEQNRRTGRKLEALARAVFKAWFVDFEPVKAKAAGATAFPGMPAAAFAALPDRLVDSELGPVPEGWSITTIKDRTSAIQYGLTTSATPEPAGPRFLRITDIRGGTVDWSTVPHCVASASDVAKYRILDGDIVVARTGASTGENLYVVEPPESVFASYLVRFQFAERGIARMVAEFMRTESYQSFVKGTIGGSAQPNANAQMLAAAEMTFPPLGIAKAFYEVVHPLDLKKAADGRESRKLAALRDYLLPRLLSGRVRATERLPSSTD